MKAKTSTLVTYGAGVFAVGVAALLSDHGLSTPVVLISTVSLAAVGITILRDRSPAERAQFEPEHELGSKLVIGPPALTFAYQTVVCLAIQAHSPTAPVVIGDLAVPAVRAGNLFFAEENAIVSSSELVGETDRYAFNS